VSTLPEDWATGEEPGEFEPSVPESEFPAVVPVRVIFDESKRLPPSFATMMTYTLQTSGLTGLGPIQILQRRITRFKAKFLINFPGAGSVYLNTKQEPLMAAPNSTPQGFTVTVVAAANNVAIPDYDGQPPLFAVASIAGVTISVMDESFGQVQSAVRGQAQ